MKILIIDGHGGGLGAQLVAAVTKNFPHFMIRAVGTNSTATVAMIKAGAKEAATGENAAVVGALWADVIVGPVGIVIADAMLGEITQRMAVAIGKSNAQRIFVPLNQCDNIIIGTANLPVVRLVQNVVDVLSGMAGEIV